MRTSILAILLLAVLQLASPAAADSIEPQVGLAFDIGRSRSESDPNRTKFDIYRIAARKDFKRDFWSGNHARLSGYWEASFNYWDTDEENVYAGALSPVFVLYLTAGSGRFQPYIEAGVGAALISDHSFAGRELSTTFQFEDRIGIGIRTRQFDLHYRFMHYSNGGIEKPNNGFDANVIGLTGIF